MPVISSLLFASLLAAPVAMGDEGCSASVLVVPDSAGDRVWSLDPFDGQVLSTDFIPDDGRLVQPINAVCSGFGRLLITDENADAIFEYDLEGNYTRTWADASDGIDAPFGLAVRGCAAYFCSRSQGIVYRLDLITGTVEPWATDLGTPRDIVFRESDALVTESGGERIVRLGLDGSVLDVWHQSDGVEGIDFPQQIQPYGDGSFVVAGFSPPNGVYVYDEDGNQTDAYDKIITSPRGVFPLGNGRILYAGGTRIMSIDPKTGDEIEIVNQSGASFRFIEDADLTPPPSGDLDGDGAVNGFDLGLMLTSWGACDFCAADLNGDGVVDGLDLCVVIGTWTG